MVDQANLAKRTETAGEHVGNVIGFAQENALLAVATEGQGVELDCRGRGRHVAQCVIEQRPWASKPSSSVSGSSLPSASRTRWPLIQVPLSTVPSVSTRVPGPL
jgi:hypothetical protein